MSKQRQRRRSQRGTTPKTEPSQIGSGGQFSVSPDNPAAKTIASFMPIDVMSQFVALVPAHPQSIGMACAAVHADAWGVLDLGLPAEPMDSQSAIDCLAARVGTGLWGLRWDALLDAPGEELPIAMMTSQPWPLLILAGISESSLSVANYIERAKTCASQIWVEVTSLDEARAIQAAGADALIVKGNEASGRVSEESTFLLLQLLRGKITIPYYMQGGLGPDTATAAVIAGASGIVLREQLWLARESPFDLEERQFWERFDGSETGTVSSKDGCYRFFSRTNRTALIDVDRELEEGASIHESVRGRLVSRGDDWTVFSQSTEVLVPLGQEIAFACGLAQKYQTVAGIINAYRSRMKANRLAARRQKALQPGGPLAATLGTGCPILQGPMTRVSDVAPFCAQVAAGGGLPFLALALMQGAETQALLQQTKTQLGSLPWGVGILGFVPAQIRRAQLEVIREVRPPYAIIAGGRPSQARQLEQYGVTTFLHVPSPGLLEIFVRDGARHFILEGRECGGHVGPRSSLTLWQSAIDTLLASKICKYEELHLVFAGGIHDGLSAAMVAAVAAPLVEKGVRIGVLMGTAYLFTEEAVTSGAIVPEYQKRALECSRTRLLESGIGHATRCIDTPFADEFQALRTKLLRAGRTPDEIRIELESLNVGRLRIASKGIERESSETSGRSGFRSVEAEEQHRRGIYMIGQVAMLRDGMTTVAALHKSVSSGHTAFMEAPSLTMDKKPDRVTNNPMTSSAERGIHDIAIVGMSGMFPSAHDVRRFWSNVVNRLDLVGEVPADRWRLDDFFNPDRSAPDQVYSRWGSFLDELIFDPLKWLIPPATIAATEPTQLMALNVALEALSDAGMDEGRIPRERTSVLIAMSGCHDTSVGYVFRTMMRHYLGQVDSVSTEEKAHLIGELGKVLPEWTEDSFPGFLLNVVAGRISNRFDLRGPNYVVDAACASSLAALHAGIEQLRSGTADCALIGAVDATNGPHTYMSFAKTHALSPTGRSRPFDESADGIALGEAISAVVIKRLEDAERDGDKIYAVIRGIGSSSDGRARSLTAPHAPGQVLALQRAYEDAGFDFDSVSLIEAHGTGTAVGDASEIMSLSTAFDTRLEGIQQIAIGSVKSMIGHSKSAAGLVSLVKTALALNQQTLPPTIGVMTPTKKINFAESPFYINSETRPWLTVDGLPRRAGVSAFGFGGTNFHVVLEEHNSNNTHESPDLMPRSAELFVWTSVDLPSLCGRLHRLLDRLNEPVLKRFDDLAALAAGVAWEQSFATREEPHRLALVAKNVADLRVLLAKVVERLKAGEEVKDPCGIYYSAATPIDPASVCFLYPGQGAQSVDMLRELVVSNRWSRQIFQAADLALQERLGTALSRLIYPPPAFTDPERDHQRDLLSQTQVAQPALGVVELFATELLNRHGVVPAAVAGHSYGEYVALCTAGVISREALIQISGERGRIAAAAYAANAGSMAAIRADEKTTLNILAECALPAVPANINAPDQTVIAGPADAVEAAVGVFTARNIRASRLPVTGAFHTPMMQKASEDFARFLDKIPLQQARIPVSSNTTSAPHSADPGEIRQVLAKHMMAPIQFVRQIEALKQSGATIFIEVGPGRVLTSLVERILGDEAIALSLDATESSGWIGFGHLLARLASLGYPLDVGAWFQGRGLREGTTADVFEAFCARTVAKPTDWILSAARAVPATPQDPPASVQSAASTSASATAKKRQPGELHPINFAEIQRSSSESATQRAPLPLAAPSPYQGEPRSVPLPAQSRVQTYANDSTDSPSMTASASHGLPPGRSLDLSSPLQSDNFIPSTPHLLQQWLELQTAQLRVTERLLTLHEQSSSQSSGEMPIRTVRSTAVQPQPDPGNAAPVQLASTQPNEASLTPVATQATVTRPFKPPIAVPFAPEVFTTASSASSSPLAVVPSATIQAQFAASGDPALRSSQLTLTSESESVSVETFERDLLQVVSNRTGYPISVLNLDMALESELGIDSIKIIEIFSKLKRYHVLFRLDNEELEEEDVEDKLERFAKLKTLRDIINLIPSSTESAGGSVERYALKSADVSSDEKKNGYPATKL